MKISSEYSRNLDPVVAHVWDTEGSAFVFANSKVLTHSLVKSLECKLNHLRKTEGGDRHADVIHIHGGLSKTHKFHLVNIFCRKVGVAGPNPRVSINTSAADLRINNPFATLVVNFE